MWGAAHFARQAVQAGNSLSSLYRTIHVAVQTSTQKPVRYIGAFTNGGIDKALQQFNADNLCAPVLFQFQL